MRSTPQIRRQNAGVSAHPIKITEPAETLLAADHQIRITIADDVDSLNVGHAAAVAFALTSPR